MNCSPDELFHGRAAGPDLDQPEPQAEAVLRSVPFRTQRAAGARWSRAIDVNETYGRSKAFSEIDEHQRGHAARRYSRA